MLNRFNHFLASFNHTSGHRVWWLGWFLGVWVVLVWLVVIFLIPVLDYNTKYYFVVLFASPLAMCGAAITKCSWNFALGWRYWYIDGMGTVGFVGQGGRRYEVCGWER